jgi:hemolysin D
VKQGKAVVAARPREVRARHELAFLPAALEIVETPPSPIGRAISLTIALLFCIAVAWASIGKVDIVTSATGKIVPSGRTKTVQPFEIGVVRAIHVQDGQQVKAGDVLIELDPTISNAERQHLENDLMSARMDVARLQAALAPGDDPAAAFAPPADAAPGLVATERQLLLDQNAEQRAKLANLDRQRAEKEADRESHAATVEKLKATIPILQQRVDIRKYLADKEYGSKLTYLETLSDLVQQQKTLPVEESNLREADATLQALVAARDQTVSEYRRTRLTELAAAEQKAAGLTQDMIKATERTRLQALTAPVDGVVQQLAVHTVGGVVTPAQQLLQVVPLDSRLEIEANVSNRDVGFVHQGQEAEIKVDTFAFTKYGLLHGTVQSVSADAIPLQQAIGNQSARSSSSDDSASEPQGQSLVYSTRVSLDRTSMDIDGNEVKLEPGMAVTVEIKTGSRRVISYLLSPLMRFRQESLRER